MKLRWTITITICLLAVLIIMTSPAAARVYIDINQPFAKKIPMAIPDFVPLDSSAPSPQDIPQ